MKQPNNFPKVASDMFFVQGIWAVGFLGILLMIQVIKTVTSIANDGTVNTFFVSAFVASNIFMLVIGIISAVGFIPHFVSNGVTRKDYFKGTIAGTAVLALAIPIVSSLVTIVFSLILKLLNMQPQLQSMRNIESDPDGSLVADFILSIVFTPYVDYSTNWLLAILVFALNIFTYYIAGWLIGAAFSRFGVVSGILSVVLAFVLILAEDRLLSKGLGLTSPGFIVSVEIPLLVSIAASLLLNAVYLWFIRQLTKRMVVKF